MLEQRFINGANQTLMSRAQRTIESVTEAVILHASGRTDPDQMPQLRFAQQAMVAKFGQMPPHVRIGLLGLTLGFSAYARGRAGRSFSQLPLARRQGLIDEWRSLPVPLCPMFVQFYEKMGPFLYYSLLEEERMPPIEVR